MGIFSTLFGSDKSTTASSNATTSNNTSNTSTTNTSTNTTTNQTDTLTQDRRLVTDHGIGVSADNSSVFTTDSGNSTSTTNNIVNTLTSDQGAIAGGIQLGMGALQSNRELAMQTIDASKWLTNSGRDMLLANIDYAQHLGDSSQALARSAISEVVAASGNALNQVTAIAAKPLNANDPQRLVIIVALGVVGLVFFSKMKA